MAIKYHTFEVESTFYGFPIDMLRYDSCFPSNERDANDIQTAISTNKQIGRPVQLACYAEKHWSPTTGRWQSFNCFVSNHKTHK